MESRAPRLGQIEIPITLVSPDEEEILCSCLNVSNTGALIRVLDEQVELKIGMRFRSKILKNGVLAEVWLQVERFDEDGVGVQFMPLEVF